MRRAVLGVLLGFALVGCKKPSRQYKTTVEIVQSRVVGGKTDPKAGPNAMDLELKYIDCPGDARRVMRGDKAFAMCGNKFKQGDKVEAEIQTSFNAAKGSYRSEVVRLGDCPVKLDLEDEANYEIVQVCTDLKASGNVVGVHCDRKRSGEIVAKCPWFAR